MTPLTKDSIKDLQSATNYILRDLSNKFDLWLTPGSDQKLNLNNGMQTVTCNTEREKEM